MPLKWKLYYWCSIYYLLWNTGFIILIIYLYFIADDGTNDSIDIFGYVMLVLMALATSKPLISFKFITHLRKKTIFKPYELNLFVTGFVLNIAVILIVANIFLLQIVGYASNTDKSPYDIPLLLSTAIFMIASLYLLIFDIPLKSLIRRQHHNDIVTIGKDIPEIL